MKLEGFAGADGDVRLRTLITIPRSAAGRVVGRGGKNVRDIQRSTGAIITLPTAGGKDHEGQPRCVEEQEEEEEEEVEALEQMDEEITVEVFGNFIATQVSVILQNKVNSSWE